jgi:hypothetical protein
MEKVKEKVGATEVRRELIEFKTSRRDHHFCAAEQLGDKNMANGTFAIQLTWTMTC